MGGERRARRSGGEGSLAIQNRLVEPKLISCQHTLLLAFSSSFVTSVEGTPSPPFPPTVDLLVLRFPYSGTAFTVLKITWDAMKNREIFLSNYKDVPIGHILVIRCLWQLQLHGKNTALPGNQPSLQHTSEHTTAWQQHTLTRKPADFILATAMPPVIFLQ